MNQWTILQNLNKIFPDDYEMTGHIRSPVYVLEIHHNLNKSVMNMFQHSYIQVTMMDIRFLDKT